MAEPLHVRKELIREQIHEIKPETALQPTHANFWRLKLVVHGVDLSDLSEKNGNMITLDLDNDAHFSAANTILKDRKYVDINTWSKIGSDVHLTMDQKEFDAIKNYLSYHR